MIRDGEVKEVVREGDVTPDLNGNFGSFSGIGVADGGRVVFSSQLTGTLGGTTDNYGVYTYGPDGLTEIIRTGEDIPDLGGTVYFLVSMALNANGEVAGKGFILLVMIRFAPSMSFFAIRTAAS